MSHIPNQICINRITIFLPFVLTLFGLILKKNCTVCSEIGDFIGFSKFTGSWLNIENGGLDWDYYNFLILYLILIGFAADFMY